MFFSSSLKVYLTFISNISLLILFICTDPNIESPLNIHAAELWDSQVLYKKIVREKYNKDVLGK